MYHSAPKATQQTEYNSYCATDSYNAWPGKQDSFGDTLLFPGKSLFPRSDDIVATCMSLRNVSVNYNSYIAHLE